MTSQTPIQIHIPPSLRHLTIPLPTFLALNKQYTNLAVGSFIFRSSKSATPDPHLLIVQRAATESGFPNKWEVPGGSCEASDPTILHSLARETFEETGLRLTRFKRQIGSGSKFVTGYGVREKQWLKLSFEIDVAEIGECDMRSGRLDGGLENVAPGENMSRDGANGVDGGMDDVCITLDPEEHQAYAWATEKEIKEGKYAVVTAEQQSLMLEAFALRKADEDKISAMLRANGAVFTKEGSSKETM